MEAPILNEIKIWVFNLTDIKHEMNINNQFLILKNKYFGFQQLFIIV